MRSTLDKETEISEKGDVVIIPCKKAHQMANLKKVNVEYLARGISQNGKGKTIDVQKLIYSC